MIIFFEEGGLSRAKILTIIYQSEFVIIILSIYTFLARIAKFSIKNYKSKD